MLQHVQAQKDKGGALRRQTAMAADFLIWLMDSEGRFFIGWEYNRTFGVTPDGRPSGASHVVPCSAVVAALHGVHRSFGMKEGVLHALCQGRAQLDGTNGAAMLETVRLLRWSKGR